MNSHKNARLTYEGRKLLIQLPDSAGTTYCNLTNGVEFENSFN
jgi:hypothetical protein